jgi:hypothetical protein
MQEIPEEVKQEIENIFKHATPQELKNLQLGIKRLDGWHSHNCVYGLLTGSCWLRRACELVILCSVLKDVKPDSGIARKLTPLEKYIDNKNCNDLVKKYLEQKFSRQ